MIFCSPSDFELTGLYQIIPLYEMQPGQLAWHFFLFWCASVLVIKAATNIIIKVADTLIHTYESISWVS